MNQRQLILKKVEYLNVSFLRQTNIDVDDNNIGLFDDVQDSNSIHRIDEICLNDNEVK